jgi:hypothetical protein
MLTLIGKSSLDELRQALIPMQRQTYKRQSNTCLVGQLRDKFREKQLQFFPRARPEDESDIVWLSMLIRGVRNNLFHGAKFRYDPGRDSELIQASLVILEAWSHCNPRVENILTVVR